MNFIKLIKFVNGNETIRNFSQIQIFIFHEKILDDEKRVRHSSEFLLF